MGKSKIYVNGKLLAEHFGGYLPVVVDVTDALEFGKENPIAVWADNSNDPNYPPGKQQEVLDFTYFGGIYRDCWLIAHNRYSSPIRIMRTKKQAEDYLSLITMYRTTLPKYY